MISPYRQPGLIALCLLILAALACSLPQTASTTPTNLPITPPATQFSPTPQASPRPTTSAKPTNRSTPLPSVADHRITTHRIYGIAGFYDQQTSDSFIPRGVNYSILIPILDHYEDRLFAVGVYDQNRTTADFAAITVAGYNTVRIIMDGCTSGNSCIGVQEGQGLNPAYLDNIVDLMNLAKKNNLFLIMASNGLPELGGYSDLANQEADQNIASGRNAEVLTAAGIETWQQYWADLLSGLIARQAPLEIVLGWELQAEQYYQSDQVPFSLEDGNIKPANGHNYDLSDSAQKEALAVDSMRYFISQERQTILNYDPTAMVTMGFLAPDSPNAWREGDERMVVSVGMLEESDLDFFDFHAYPGAGLSISELSQNFGLGGHITRPILMGEVGAYTWTYPEVSDGVIVIQDWIADSCTYGFSGWLYRGYYPEPAGLPDASWGFVDEQNSILNALSPNFQPDACTTTVLPGRNLALGKPVSVSGALPEQPPQMAVDGDPNTQWSSGGYPMQWIEIDLGELYAVGKIRLTVGQWPEGEVLHQLWVGTSQDAMRQVYEVSGEEYDYDVLSFMPEKPLENIRFVRIITTESPSWVSWREIEVLAPFPSTPTPTAEATATSTP
jgi:hypothetical protein